MSDDALHALAVRAGLVTVWHDIYGNERHVSPETIRAVLIALGLDPASEESCREQIAILDREDHTLPPLVTGMVGDELVLPHPPGTARLHLDDESVHDVDLEDRGDGRSALAGLARPGYHHLEFDDRAVTLAIAPPRAFGIADALRARRREGRIWGLAAQIYSLRRDGDGGIGDFAALATLAEAAARQGADALAISPVHALYASEPGHYGPYAPSSRIALNPVYAPVDCRGKPYGADYLIDWQAATPRRYASLRATFLHDHGNPDFVAFHEKAPAAIIQHALFEAIAADQVAAGNGRDWRQWPEALRAPSGHAVAEVASRLRHEIAFHLYAQFRAHAGLEAAQRAATEAGMAIGLIADLAVGTDPAGSDAWARPDEVLRGVSVGAPPDDFNRNGQRWGLTAFSPRGLRHSGFAALRDMLEAALMPTGGVRIDHAMGLARLWVVPDGAEATEGCYLRFPFEDMRRIVMLESMCHRGIVLAEDLGTVPEGFRPSIGAAGLAGMSVLWFERDGDRFVPPAQWRADTVAMTSTHDLPTIAGWWHGTDIAWRERLGLPGDDSARRAHDRTRLWEACHESGSADGPMPSIEDTDTVVDAVTTHVGTASSDLVILALEDALGMTEQPNIPGTIDEHPNWRRRMHAPVATMLDDRPVVSRLARLGRARRR